MEAKKVLVATLIVVGVMLSLGFLYIVREIIIILVFALLLAIAIEPLVIALERTRLPRSMAILLIYVVLVSTLAVSLQWLLPQLGRELSTLWRNLPAYTVQLREYAAWLEETWGYRIDVPELTQIASRLDDTFTILATGALRVTVGFFGFVAGLITVLAFAYYWLMERHHIEDTWFALLPEDKRLEARSIWYQIVGRLGAFIRGELVLMLFVGSLVTIGLLALDVPFALVLGVIAGLTEVIPIIGPVIGAIPAVIIALFHSPWLAIAVVVLYVMVQQIENNVLVPKVMEKTVGLSPLTALLAVLIGGRLLGIVGIVLAVPVASAVQTLVLRLVLERNRRREASDLERVGDRA